MKVCLTIIRPEESTSQSAYIFDLPNIEWSQKQTLIFGYNDFDYQLFTLILKRYFLSKIFMHESQKQEYSQCINKKKHNQENISDALEKYKVIKMVSSGDYICHDKIGNTNLLVLQLHKKGIESFRQNSQSKFYRNSNNRSLLIPIEDILYEGGIFTVYALPSDAILISDVSLTKLQSQFFCLSLLYSLISKVVKPLLTIFGNNAHKWFYVNNIWVKQTKAFYILKKRANVENEINIRKSREIDQFNIDGQAYEKKMLRKLCCYLVTLFRYDPQLKSFQSTILDSLLNEQFSINQILFLLKDKKKRKSFMEERKQPQLSQNITIKTNLTFENEFWSRKKKPSLESVRRQLKTQMESVDDLLHTPIRIVQNFRETIRIPPVLNSQRRSSLMTKRLFDFKDICRKNRSLSENSNKNGCRVGSFNSPKSIEQKLKIFVKQHPIKRKSFSLNINQKSNKELNGQHTLVHQKMVSRSTVKTLQECHKNIQSFLNSKQKNKKFKTIDVSRSERSSCKTDFLIEQSLKIPNFNATNIKNQIQNRQTVNFHKNFEKRSERVSFSLKQSQVKMMPDLQQYKSDSLVDILLTSHKVSPSEEPKQANESIIQKEKKNERIKTEQRQQGGKKKKKEKLQVKEQSKETRIQGREKLENKEIKIVQKQPFHSMKQEIAKSLSQISEIKIAEDEPIEEIILTKNQNQQHIVKPKQNQISTFSFSGSSTQKHSQPKNVFRSRKIIETILTQKTTVSEQVNQYVGMINKMGETVSKSSRISAKLDGVQWFTGIYFIYKRFLYERKKIEKWLEKREAKITREQEKNEDEWNEWFSSQQKTSLEKKIKSQNEDIVCSIIKMNKRIMKKKIHKTFLHHASLSRRSDDESKIAVSEVVKQFDFFEEKQMLNDDQIFTHANDLFHCLYVISEMDGKIKEKKKLFEVFISRNEKELSDYSDFIYDLYIKG